MEIKIRLIQKPHDRAVNAEIEIDGKYITEYLHITNLETLMDLVANNPNVENAFNKAKGE
jgi:hypothetical protein